MRTEGLYRGAAKDLRKRLGKLSVGQNAVQLGKDLTKFVAAEAKQLRRGERLPACSEVIETCFGKFKTLEREQAKGGFTGLLLALAACVAERTQEVVHEALLKSSRSHPESGCILNRLPRNPRYFSVNSWMIVNISYDRYLSSRTVVDFGSCEVFSMVFV